MPTTECQNCGGTYHWYWEEAFAKFGFGDGDGQVETWQVEEVLKSAGYEVVTEDWGCHNLVIMSIKRDGKDLIPRNCIRFGYDNPRGYLPGEIVALLDTALPSDGSADFLF